MSEETNNLQTNDDGTQANSQQDNPDIRNLREKAKRADTLESDNSRLARENSLLKAGVNNLTEKQLTALNAAHGDGEITPEALRKTAEELGFAQPIPETSTDEQQKHQQVNDAASGSTRPEQQPLVDQYAQANSPAEVLDLVRKNGGVVADDLQ